MRLKPLLLTVLLMASLATAALIVGRVKNPLSNQGFTLHLKITDYPADGRDPIVGATEVRYHKSDGSWKMEKTYANGRIDVGFGQMGRGVFHVDEKKQRLDYVSGLSDRIATEETLRAMPGFVGEETILGFRTLHFHSVSQETGEVSDTYICPALQAYPIKIVSVSRNGAKNVYEVTQVIVGEPAQGLFASLPNYPVDTTHYEQVHGSGSAPTVQNPK